MAGAALRVNGSISPSPRPRSPRRLTEEPIARLANAEGKRCHGPSHQARSPPPAQPTRDQPSPGARRGAAAAQLAAVATQRPSALVPIPHVRSRSAIAASRHRDPPPIIHRRTIPHQPGATQHPISLGVTPPSSLLAPLAPARAPPPRRQRFQGVPSLTLCAPPRYTGTAPMAAAPESLDLRRARDDRGPRRDGAHRAARDARSSRFSCPR